MSEATEKTEKTEAEAVPPKNGAELTRLLAKHGTGKDKLDICRAVLQRVYDEEKGKRVATCEEVLAGLRESLHEKHKTLEKAECLAKTGTWAGPDQAKPKTIDELLAPTPEEVAEEKKRQAEAKKPGLVKK